MPDAHRDEFEQIKGIIAGHGSFLVTGHVDPDGDCIGSMFAICLYLRSLGKKVICFAPGDISHRLLQLPGADSLVTREEVEATRFEVVFTVDSPTAGRIDNVLDPVSGKPVVNIDHHPGNEMFGTVNVVDETAAAAAMIVMEMLTAIAPGSIDPDIASLLYLGILMDTGAFRFQNTGPEALRAAGKLMEYGARAYELTHEFIYMRKFRTLKLLSLVLDTLEVHSGGRIATMEITRSMLEKTGSEFSDSEGFVDYGAAIDDVELVALFREIEPDRVRVSLRSRNHHDVAAIAARFGGGGHSKAAGLTVESDLATARGQVLESLAALYAGGEGTRDTDEE
ncbi:MAG TPA: bifunctional oligoribonuclease/PAP phosphatase NrnA [Candidatus Krumholzibacterium sp.]|nr:bifunctional oligoribonuclease/PAP phosphatase NrnA [Candidatus Krumholzibacterium sp.]